MVKKFGVVVNVNGYIKKGLSTKFSNYLNSTMTVIFHKILIFFLLLVLPQEILQHENSKLTSIGIDNCVKKNEAEFIREFQDLVKDTIYNDVFFTTKNFKKTTDKKQYDPMALAYIDISKSSSCEIFVNNEEKFSGYSYKSANQSLFDEYDYFLKATVFHEIMHYYFYQCILEMEKIRNIDVDNYYDGILTIPNPEQIYGSKFIEEGICEYFVQRIGESPIMKNYYKPKFKSDFMVKTKMFDIQYAYSSIFLKDFLDASIENSGRLKFGIFALLRNPPPTYEEILNPDKYFNRLK